MAKGKTLVLRISEELKQAIADAAGKRSQSMSTFIEDAVTAVLRRPERKRRAKAVHGAHSGVPTWFRASAWTASSGGAHGYEGVGLALAGALGTEAPWDIDDLDGWDAEIEDLRAAMAEGDREAAWDWFVDHYPEMMKLIPPRRRPQFLDGVQRRYDEDGLEI